MKEGELVYANGDRYKGLFKVVIAPPPQPRFTCAHTRLSAAPSTTGRRAGRPR
jgi:hypothetical protein